ncbi:hypothetical protein HGI47_18530 [Novosphingobium sp. ERN07]|uniref:hypothetical protein n=1 Tax=Novosphingobium sp. ERN07 TaxID=2726187 RepID=UPI00145672D6|nr:hypothetical protein [Novosphingobium sp. ERN07]NLR72876.1 hypothetical protein [Novosphingobium sp. ERN07]
MEAQIVFGRSCGTCSMCCKVLAIEELKKPFGVWCQHVRKGKGCSIYADRPPSCAAYGCGYLYWSETGEHWFPSRAKMVVELEDDSRLLVRVDRATPNVWRTQPYYADIKRWARIAELHGQQVAVMVGRNMTIVMAEHDVDVGFVSEDEVVILSEKRDGSFSVSKIPRNDPRFAKVKTGIFRTHG